jgi:hypothetical protein
VFPGGNGGCYVPQGLSNAGCQVDNANFDGYVNRRGVVTVCAVDDDGRRPWYGEPGANLLVCAPSSGDRPQRITTTALRGDHRGDFSGTSASTPMVSGVVALMLAANPQLTWRDVRLVLARTARRNDEGDAGWSTGPSGLWFNHKYGFGVADAGAAVALAPGWASVGGSESLRTCTAAPRTPALRFPTPRPRRRDRGPGRRRARRLRHHPHRVRRGRRDDRAHVRRRPADPAAQPVGHEQRAGGRAAVRLARHRPLRPQRPAGPSAPTVTSTSRPPAPGRSRSPIACRSTPGASSAGHCASMAADPRARLVAAALAACCGCAFAVAPTTPDERTATIANAKPARLQPKGAATPALAWHDGAGWRELRIDPTREADLSPRTGAGPVVLRPAGATPKWAGAQVSPVLVDEAGRERALPGGVLVVLREPHRRRRRASGGLGRRRGAGAPGSATRPGWSRRRRARVARAREPPPGERALRVGPAELVGPPRAEVGAPRPAPGPGREGPTIGGPPPPPSDMRTDQPVTVRRLDYTPPVHFVDRVALRFDLDPVRTIVTATLAVRRRADAPADAPLRLDGESLELLSASIDGVPVPAGRLHAGPDGLRVDDVPEAFELTTVTAISPEANTELAGLYVSSGGLFTQCEAQGFRRITWFPDRPDVMARYEVELVADRARFPVLLSNGNLVGEGALPDGRHFARWVDPFPKPCYLFALVAATLVAREERIVTMSGREALLQVWVEPGQLGRTDHAMQSLIRSIRWDERRFGLELDLDRFMIVAVGDFNMGAMENKGLNVFNTKYVFAHPRIATDTDFANVESVVAHEYFHNWTGNRVTCRDWFQLTLKEGLTVFRTRSSRPTCSPRRRPTRLGAQRAGGQAHRRRARAARGAVRRGCGPDGAPDPAPTPTRRSTTSTP